jgi:hypothetical protein
MHVSRKFIADIFVNFNNNLSAKVQIQTLPQGGRAKKNPRFRKEAEIHKKNKTNSGSQKTSSPKIL